MSDKTKATTIIPSLTALESHPDFQRGISSAQEFFLNHHDPTPLTEDEMINEIKEGLESAGRNGPSYFYHLGFLFGTINEGLTYAG
jgi:hypothetical protein